MTVTNDDGVTTTQAFCVLVNNVAPTATLSGPTTAITGTPAEYSVTVSDGDGGMTTRFIDVNVTSAVTTARVSAPVIDDGDGDCSAGGGYRFGNQAIDSFFRLFGDGNGDRIINSPDSTLFAQTYRKSTGHAGFNRAFDSDNDGDVDATDYAFMRNQLNKTMAFV